MLESNKQDAYILMLVFMDEYEFFMSSKIVFYSAINERVADLRLGFQV